MLNEYPQVDTPARVKGFNEDLRARLETYRDENSLSREQLGRQLGFSGTVVSKYLNGKPEGDVVKFEALASDVLKAADQRKSRKVILVDTSVSKEVASALETIRKTNDIGLVTGNAGIGKSSGVEKYRFSNPTAIIITCSKWCCNFSDIFRAFWASIETSGWTGKTKKIDYILDRFVDSNRLIIFDNGHRLKPGGLEFVFDFYDATNCPIALVGNPEVVEKLQKNDQQFSRIGFHKHIDRVATKTKSVDGAEVNLPATIIQQVNPAFADCEDLAEKVMSQRGHVRSLRKQISLADELAGSDAFKKHCAPDEINRKAFKAAHKHLIRNYDL
jgi:DNA transposition AAA+ family ATPase